VPGVYEATSRVTSGPAGYEGRAAFDVRDDGAIEVIAFGPKRRSPSRELVRELLRRIAAHDARGGVTRVRLENDARMRVAVAEVRNDALIEQLGLPDLVGTEKQVRWAMDIRRRALEGRRDWADLTENVHRYTEARWWIENRDNIYGAFHRIGVERILSAAKR
jgi:hypothetical protein